MWGVQLGFSLLLVSFLFALVGCGLQVQEPRAPSTWSFDPWPRPAPPLEATYFSATIPSFDGTPIALTVFQPALREGESAPLLLHSHGWGGHRLRQPGDNEYSGLAPETLQGLLPAQGLVNLVAELAEQAWRNGYYVLSFDQRGFGDSGGRTRVMDPTYEGRDAQAVLDWALAHLRVARRNGKPVIGAFGLSYGGGFQLILSGLDDRVQALLPIITWHDLRYSLAPGGVPKTAWNLLLFGTGAIQGRLDPILYRSFLEGLLQNRLSSETLLFLKSHSPIAFCEEGWPGKPLHALFIQGMRDTLFNLNEAYENLRCLQRGGGDVRLFTIQDGHLLPLLQRPPGGTNCGPYPLGPGEALAWFEEKLRGRAGAARQIPRLCLSLSPEASLTPPEMPLGGEILELPWTSVSLLDASQSFNFVPLKRMRRSGALAGIPVYRLEVHGPAERAQEAVVFVGIGIRKAGSLKAHLVDEQVLPLKGYGFFQGELPGVGTRLEPGDEVGLILLGWNDQYALVNRTPFLAFVRGSVALPLH